MVVGSKQQLAVSCYVFLPRAFLIIIITKKYQNLGINTEKDS